jgi:serine/threonine-protein phosphatase 2A regulatory subunit A
LASLAEVIGGLTDHLGGGQSLLALTKPLELLASTEEGIIRDKAIESMKKILSLCKAKEGETEIMGIIKRLINNAETFASKLAAIAIIPSYFAQMSTANQQEMVR